MELSRIVRFSTNPFLTQDSPGFNSFASKPAGEGLTLFFELLVELTGEVNTKTGFVVNATEIDEAVRESVVPIFADRIKNLYLQHAHIGLGEIVKLLRLTHKSLTDKFRPACLSKLSLKLNPFRKVTTDLKNDKIIYFSEKFEFAATHTLWNRDFSPRRNLQVFGNCANPTGHGHNYIIEVTVKKPVEETNFCISDFEKTVSTELIKLVDHKNLNKDVSEFTKVNPTVENIAAFSWRRLCGKFANAQLHCVTVWETDRIYCSYYGS